MNGIILENEQLSAQALFNFTKNFDWLKLKITDRFKPRLVLEDYTLFLDFKRAIPMICFCDIRLSNISIHMKEYGNYGIGLKKEWGIDKGLNPITYISSKQSYFFESFKKLMRDHPESKEVAAELFTHFKPYYGQQNNKYRNFYNEREWRFIPNECIKQCLAIEDYNNEVTREKVNKQLSEDYKLDYDFDDIKYIIIQNNSEKEEIVNIISSAFSVSKEEVYKNICFLTREIIEKDL